MAGASFSKATIQILLNAQSALKDLKTFQNNFTSGMGTMKTALAGFVGYQGLKGAYDSVKQLTDVSDKWEIPTEKMSRFRNIIIAMGGDMQEALTSFETLKQAAQQWQFSSNGPLRDLSAKIRDNLFKKDPEAVLATLREHWPQLPLEARNNALDTLGTNSVGIRNLLKATDAEYAAAQYKADRMPVVAPEDAQAARDIKKYSEETAVNINKVLSGINNLVSTKGLAVLAGASRVAATPGTATTSDAASLGGLVAAGGVATALSGKGVGAGIKGVGAIASKMGATTAGATLGAKGAGVAAAGSSLGSTLGIAGIGTAIGMGLMHLVAYLTDNVLTNGAENRQERLRRLENGKYADLEQYWKDLAWTNVELKQGNNIWTGNPAVSDEELIRSDTLLKKRVSDFVAQAALHDPDSLSRNWKNNKDFQELVKKYAPQTVNQTINIYGIKGAEDIAPALRSVVMQNMSPTQGYGG